MCCWRFLGRAFCVGSLALLALGCQPSDNILLGDGDNPHLKAGLARVNAADYDRAIQHFDQALETNPNSVRAHFELGLIYQNHNQDYVSALYHYKKVLAFKQTGWPAENVRQLIAGCREALIQTEVVIPISQAQRRDLVELRKENEMLRKELAQFRKNQPDSNLVPTFQPIPKSALPKPTTPTASPTPKTTTPPGPHPRQPYIPGRTKYARGSGLTIHYIKKGETLMGLSRKYGISVQVIQAANPGLNPRTIGIGKAIRIPKSR